MVGDHGGVFDVEFAYKVGAKGVGDGKYAV